VVTRIIKKISRTLGVTQLARRIGILPPRPAAQAPDLSHLGKPVLPADLPQKPPGCDLELGAWLCQLPDNPEFQTIHEALTARTDLRSLISALEMSTLVMLVRRLRPRLFLEIGTFFAGTTRIVAEAMQSYTGGRIVTVDPYGGGRVPGILRHWPAALRNRVDFQPAFSMSYFGSLDDANAPRGVRSPLSMAFVDGNHNLEYALFDIMRCANYLAPGGVIIVDNMEQVGPREAVLRFLNGNPAWRLYCNGKLLRRQADPVELGRQIDGANWGVLIAPQGIQIGAMTFKSHERMIPYQSIEAVRFNVVAAVGSGTLAVNLNYAAFPGDYETAGTGLVQQVGCGQAVWGAGAAPIIRFQPPLELALLKTKLYTLSRELEVTFRADQGEGAYILLHKIEPMTFLGETPKQQPNVYVRPSRWRGAA
jgi:predicted O-methyltransferase YrrM